jgi:thioesterase domain-containing protein/acyl carrier protein
MSRLKLRMAEDALSQNTKVAGEFERRLQGICTAVFNKDRLSINAGSNFFELDGQSLKTGSLLSHIQKEFKLEFSETDISENPTLREMALKIQAEVNKRYCEDCIILIKQGEQEGRNIFFIHDGSGDVQGYIDLSGFFSEYSCWGIRSITLDNESPANMKVEDIAGTYVQLIRSKQKNGPYAICGWSLGGTIGFEVARQLEEAGCTVAFLIMIDTQFPVDENDEEARLQEVFSLEEEKMMLTGIFKDMGPLFDSVNTIEALWDLAVILFKENASLVTEVRSNIPEHIISLIPNVDKLTIDEFIKQVNTVRTLEKAIDNYIPAARLNATLLYMGASESHWDISTYGQYFKNKPEVHVLNGTHLSLLRYPRVNYMAELLKPVMASACSESSSKIIRQEFLQLQEA